MEDLPDAMGDLLLVLLGFGIMLGQHIVASRRHHQLQAGQQNVLENLQGVKQILVHNYGEVDELPSDAGGSTQAAQPLSSPATEAKKYKPKTKGSTLGGWVRSFPLPFVGRRGQKRAFEGGSKEEGNDLRGALSAKVPRVLGWEQQGPGNGARLQTQVDKEGAAPPMRCGCPVPANVAPICLQCLNCQRPFHPFSLKDLEEPALVVVDGACAVHNSTCAPCRAIVIACQESTERYMKAEQEKRAAEQAAYQAKWEAERKAAQEEEEMVEEEEEEDEDKDDDEEGDDKAEEEEQDEAEQEDGEDDEEKDDDEEVDEDADDDGKDGDHVGMQLESARPPEDQGEEDKPDDEAVDGKKLPEAAQEGAIEGMEEAQVKFGAGTEAADQIPLAWRAWAQALAGDVQKPQQQQPAATAVAGQQQGGAAPEDYVELYWALQQRMRSEYLQDLRDCIQLLEALGRSGKQDITNLLIALRNSLEILLQQRETCTRVIAPSDHATIARMMEKLGPYLQKLRPKLEAQCEKLQAQREVPRGRTFLGKTVVFERSWLLRQWPGRAGRAVGNDEGNDDASLDVPQAATVAGSIAERLVQENKEQGGGSDSNGPEEDDYLRMADEAVALFGGAEEEAAAEAAEQALAAGGKGAVDAAAVGMDTDDDFNEVD